MLLLALLVVTASSEKLWKPAPEDPNVDGYIRQVHVLFRHGHREPKTKFPTDPNKHSPIWKNGPGELTILGRQQGYLLGRNIQSRYARLIPEERAWKAVRATSSDVQRTLMTGAVVLAGLMPPGNDDKWSELNWQPVAIHTKPTDIDNTLASHPKCPRYDHLLNQVPTNSGIQKLYDYLTVQSGKKIATLTSLLNLYTCLDIQQQAGLALPDWTRPVFTLMKNKSVLALLRSTQTLELTRLRSGPLIETLIDFDRNVIYPVVLYSTHDTVLGGLLGALNVSMNEPPNFTSAVIIEYRQIEEKIHAQLWYRSRPEDELVRVPWPGCGVRCQLERLREIMEPLIPGNWSEECMFRLSKGGENSTVVDPIPVWFGVLCCLVIVVAVCLHIFCHKRYRYEVLLP